MVTRPIIHRHFLAFPFYSVFPACLNYDGFLCVQTSVAVISPSKAKSVCSLSVCIHRHTQTGPSWKQEKQEQPNLWTFDYLHLCSTEILHSHNNGEDGNALAVCTVSYRLLDNTADTFCKRTTTKQTVKKQMKNKQKQNRLRGRWNLRSVTLTFQGNIWYIFFKSIIQICDYERLHPGLCQSLHVDMTFAV